jgi:peptide methionine sulfoxide reductase MsrA
MTQTNSPLATITLNSSVLTITFDNIPATYRDLIIVMAGVSTGGTLFAKFNNDTGANYNSSLMYSTGTSVVASNALNQSIGFVGYPGNPSVQRIEFLDYAATDKHKNVLSRSVRATLIASHYLRWSSTAALTKIELSQSGSGTFNSGTTCSLYGVIA